MSYIDCHCHLADNYFYKQINELIFGWKEKGIISIGAIATNPKTSKRNIILGKKFPEIVKAGIGRHPWGAHKFDEKEQVIFSKLIEEETVAIIGEVGLDYYFIKDQKKYNKQKEVFEFFIQLAEKNNKPLMIHLTGAEKTVYEMLTTINPNCSICCHWYSGPKQILKKLVDLDCYFSINPAISKSKNHEKVLSYSPVDKLLTESDGPVKYKEEKSSPLLTVNLTKYIAEIKKIEEQEMRKQFVKNFKGYLKG